MKRGHDNRLSDVANRVLSPLDACVVRRSRLAALEEELRQTRDEVRTLREQVGANGHARPDPVTGQSVLAVPLFHYMTLTALPGTHVYRRVEEVLARQLDTLRELVAALNPLLYGPELARVPAEAAAPTEPHWNNGYFSGADARAAYALTAHFKPSRIVEVGGGNSTKFFRLAIRDHALPTRLVTIDPFPRAEIDAVSDEVVRRDVAEVDPALFASLAPGDFLFLDGSHLVFSGTDVVHAFLEILPVVRPGVVVHVHDIPLPYEYHEEFAAVRRYNEQYMLAVLLLFGASWHPLFPVHYLATQGLLRDDGYSFWMRRE